MKNIFFLFLGITVLLCSCLAPKIYEISNKPDDSSLLLYYKDDYFGYINSDTLEIVIPAQYIYADSFVGNFAIVQKQGGNLSVINKQNMEILSRFDSVTLYESENSDTVFALAGTDRGRWFSFSRGSMSDGSPAIPLPGISFGPTRSTRRLYNLTTGKLIFQFKRMASSRMLFIDNYIIIGAEINDTSSVRNRNHAVFTPEGIVYEIKPDGTLVESDMSPEVLIERIAEERNMQYRGNDFHYYRELNFDALFWYSDTLDITMLIKNISDKFFIKEADRDDWRFEENNPVYYIEPINRNVNYPLQATTLYSVSIVANNSSRAEYIGLYDSLSNEWVIAPGIGTRIIPRNTEHWFYVDGGGRSGYDPLNIYSRLYNIRNSELSDNPMFRTLHYDPRIISRGLRYNTIVYYGYDEGFVND